MKIHLVRDCLDKQVIDSKGRKIGRVDGILIETSGPGRHRIAAIEIGATTLAARLPTLISHRLNRVVVRLSGLHENKLTVPIKKTDVGHNEVRVAVDAESTIMRALEHWLRERIVMRIPGA